MSKHKEAICEVLKKSGPLQGSFLKERVLAFLNLDDSEYPKSTFLNHLVQLVDEFKITFEIIDNKRIYSFKNFEHDVPGGLILENMGGRIKIPNLLKVFNPKITQGSSALDNKNEIHFYFEFNSTNFCLSIHKDSVPIKLHISRIHHQDTIQDEIVKLFGSRTITLELPINNISSFKTNERSGQNLIEILENDIVKITDLQATNSSTILKTADLNDQLFFQNFSQSQGKTIHNDWIEKKTSDIENIKLTQKGTFESTNPTVIFLSNGNILLIT